MKTRLAVVLGLSLFAPRAGAQSMPDASSWPEEAAAPARRGEFGSAADALERPMRALAEQPAERAARAALAQLRAAVRVRAALGDAEATALDATTAVALGERVPALRSEAYAVVEAAGGACETRASRSPASMGYGECRALYELALDRFGAGAPLDVRVRARVALGRIAAALGDRNAAHAHYRAAIEAYRADTHEPGALDVGIEGAEPYLAALVREEQREERVERAREAAQEARCRRDPHGCRRGVTSPPCGSHSFGVLSTVEDEGNDDARHSEAELVAGSSGQRARAAVVEARFALAQRSMLHFAAMLPGSVGPPTRRDYEAWTRRGGAPTMVPQLRALSELLAPQLQRVSRMHVGPWEPAALASFAEACLGFAGFVRFLAPARAEHSAAGVRDIDGSLHDAFATEFEELARGRLLACVRAAIAERAAEPLARCEAALARVDGPRHPPSDELVPALRAGR